MLRAGSAQHRKLAGVEMVVGVCASFCACCDDIHNQSRPSPGPGPQSALSQQLGNASLSSLPSSPHNLGFSEVSLWTGILPSKTAFLPRTFSTAASDGWWIPILGPVIPELVGRATFTRTRGITSPRVSLLSVRVVVDFRPPNRVALHSPNSGIAELAPQPSRTRTRRLKWISGARRRATNTHRQSA
jgi:hypothetical protein